MDRVDRLGMNRWIEGFGGRPRWWTGQREKIHQVAGHAGLSVESLVWMRLRRRVRWARVAGFFWAVRTQRRVWTMVLWVRWKAVAMSRRGRWGRIRRRGSWRPGGARRLCGRGGCRRRGREGCG